MTSVKGLRDRAILAVLLYHGLRREEAAQLGVSDIVERRGIKHLLVHGKGSKMTSKIHMLCDANGVPLRSCCQRRTSQQYAYAQPLLDGAFIPSLRGRPRKRCRWLLADKGYDAQALRHYCDRYRMHP